MKMFASYPIVGTRPAAFIAFCTMLVPEGTAPMLKIGEAGAGAVPGALVVDLDRHGVDRLRDQPALAVPAQLALLELLDRDLVERGRAGRSTISLCLSSMRIAARPPSSASLPGSTVTYAALPYEPAAPTGRRGRSTSPADRHQRRPRRNTSPTVGVRRRLVQLVDNDDIGARRHAQVACPRTHAAHGSPRSRKSAARERRRSSSQKRVPARPSR